MNIFRRTHCDFSSEKYIANLCITYKLDKWFKDLNTYFTLGNSLFEAIKLTQNADSDRNIAVTA